MLAGLAGYAENPAGGQGKDRAIWENLVNSTNFLINLDVHVFLYVSIESAWHTLVQQNRF